MCVYLTFTLSPDLDERLVLRALFFPDLCRPTLASPLHSKQYMFFAKNPSVQSLCNPRRILQGFSWGCIVIVLKGSF